MSAYYLKADVLSFRGRCPLSAISGRAEAHGRAPPRDRSQALVPRAFDMSASVAFSASLTLTPPMPRKPHSEEASATCSLIVCNHALNPAASCGALASRMADTSFKLASER